MLKIGSYICLVFLSYFSISQKAQPLDFGEGFKYIGNLKPRTTQEIVGSDLWIGGEVLDRDYAKYHEYKTYLDSLGAKKIRLQSGWAKTEKEKGEYNFAWLDHIVDDALSREIEPWVQISYGNELYPGAGGISLGEGLPTSEIAYEAWLNYTRALVSHFCGRVNEWEIWNEADHRYNDAGPEQYAKLFYETAKVVKEVQPNAKVIGLSIAGVGKTEFVELFFDYLKERDALDLIDAATFHGYPTNPDNGFEDVSRLQQVIYKYRPGLPLWQGETGCPSTFGSSGALSGHEWTELTQAKWDLRRALAHVGRGYPFSLFTISEYNYNRQKFKGLNSKGILKINEDLSIAHAKPAYYAYQNLTSLLDHRYERIPLFQYEIENAENTSVFVFADKTSGSLLCFIWDKQNIPSDSNQLTRLQFSLSKHFTDPVLLDIRTGGVYEIDASNYIDNGDSFIFPDLPIYDSPIAIVERGAISLL